MAPPIASGKQRENFVRWKEAPKSMERDQANVGGTSPLVAKRKVHASRPRSIVMEDADLQRRSESTQVPQNRRASDCERETDPKVGALLKWPPQIPKYTSPYKFVPPRATGPSPSVVSVVPPQAILSPQGRPSKKVQQQREEIVHDAPCSELHNIGPHTSAKYHEGKCKSSQRRI